MAYGLIVGWFLRSPTCLPPRFFQSIFFQKPKAHTRDVKWEPKMSLTAPTSLQKNHNNELREGLRNKLQQNWKLEALDPRKPWFFIWEVVKNKYVQPFPKTSPQVFQTVFNIYKNVSNPALEALSTRQQKEIKTYANCTKNHFPRLSPRTTEPNRNLGMEDQNQKHSGGLSAQRSWIGNKKRKQSNKQMSPKAIKNH